jgi:hypothetical protein
MSVTLSTGMIIVGKREDDWAIQNPPPGKYWRCWQCDNGTRVNDFILVFEWYPVIANNWYIAGPFFTGDEADAYEFDGVNPCGNVPGKGTADSATGGGSGFNNEMHGNGVQGIGVLGGGLRWIFTHPPIGAVPPIAEFTVNGVEIKADNVTYNYVSLPTSLGGP